MVPQLARFIHQRVLKTSPPSKSPGKHLCKKPLAPVKRSSQGTQTLLSIFQFSSGFQSCLTLCDPMDCSTPGFPVHHQLPELAQTHVHQVCDAIQPSRPLLSPSPAFNLAQHQSLFQESVLCIRWPEYWSFSFSISPSNECSGLIFLRMDWFDFLADQETLRSLLQHHSLKAFYCRGSSNHLWGNMRAIELFITEIKLLF